MWYHKLSPNKKHTESWCRLWMKVSLQKRFIPNETINRATSGSEPTLHIIEQIVEFKVPDKSTVDHSFQGFTYATCQRNMTIIGRIC